MKKLIFPFFVLLATAAFAADAPSLTGTWKIHNVIVGNESFQECTFTQADKTLSGTCKSDNGDIKIAGTVDGKNATWKYESDYNGTPITLTYTGTLDDSGKLSGTVDVAPFNASGDFDAVPVKPTIPANK